MILLDPAGYTRQPWKNGLGVSVEIAAERDGEGWEGLVWSFSRTGFAVPSAFSDLRGIDRIIAVVEGSGLTLRALDRGESLSARPLQPLGFDGGRKFEGVPDGPLRVCNLMGRRGRVRIAMRFVMSGAPRQTAKGGIVLMHACQGEVHLADGTVLPAEWTRRHEADPVELGVLSGVLLVATIDRLAR
jgi:environmental stress-induced protein Ves